MAANAAIEKKLESQMVGKFQSVSDTKIAIHLTALVGAAICAALPIGVDAWALRLAEVIMIICIASRFGEKLTRSVARGILASSFAQLVGEGAALSALIAADAASLLNPLIAYGIKSSIAVGLIEAIGHTALRHYEKKYEDLKKKQLTTFDAICVVGGIADIARAASLAGDLIETPNVLADNTAAQVTFTGSREGFSDGHSESWWKKKIAEAIAEGNTSGRRLAEKRLEEAIQARLTKEAKKAAEKTAEKAAEKAAIKAAAKVAAKAATH